jgi:hypothetical protein
LPSFFAIVGCRDARSYDRKVALELCAAQIAVFPPGQPPQQPYRVVAPVEARWGISVTSRFLKLKREACALGANAIIDAGERDRERGGSTAAMERVYLGQGGIADAMVTAIAAAGFADGWHTHLALDRDAGGWIRTAVGDAAAARTLSKATNGEYGLAGDGIELRLFLAEDRSLKLEVDTRVGDRLLERRLQVERAVRERLRR